MDFVKRQRQRASFLAFAVNKFWRMAEASLTKGKAGHLICDKSGKKAEARNDRNEAVPMDVDIPASREVPRLSLPIVKKPKLVPVVTLLIF